ncbi:MAG: carbon-nitrogen hydrolase family protein [Bacteroidetes bacterium]|nr:carbon-nitrogen hydrolase family protein [Bacteroidota bacterium]
MKKTVSLRLLIFASLLFLGNIKGELLLAERYVTVATIGNAPAAIKTDNKQEIVDHVISFWDRELKQVLPDKPDLIVLPEFCDLSGEGEEYLKVRQNQVLDFFSSVSKSNKCYIAYGTQRKDKDGNWRNSCIVIDRNGSIAGIYDKNFPTIGEMESGIKASNEAKIIECDFGRVAIAICFDLNFDELRIKYAKEKPDLIIFSSMYHGGNVQSTWAYTCRSHFVGAVYKGNPSEIRNPMGDVIASNTNYFDFAVAKINLDCRLVHLDYNWARLTSLKNKYGTTVKISDPGKLASVLITSENSKVTADDMIKEFEIEMLDDYMKRARDFRMKPGNLK